MWFHLCTPPTISKTSINAPKAVILPLSNLKQPCVHLTSFLRLSCSIFSVLLPLVGFNHLLPRFPHSHESKPWAGYDVCLETYFCHYLNLLFSPHCLPSGVGKSVIAKSFPTKINFQQRERGRGGDRQRETGINLYKEKKRKRWRENEQSRSVWIYFWQYCEQDHRLYSLMWEKGNHCLI